MLLIFVGILFYINGTYAQTDTEFWFAAPAVTKGHANKPIVFRITSYDKPALVTISQPANASFKPIVIQLLSNQMIPIDVTDYLSQIESMPSLNPLNTGIKITATNNISVYYEVVGTNTNGAVVNPEIFPLKGRSAMGVEFIIPSQMRFNNHTGDNPPANNGFIIVATEDNTKVEITLTNPNAFGNKANELYTITLQKGETYSVNGSSHLASLHLGGSFVKSNKPICITIYDDSILIGTNYDLVGDQIVPIVNTGSEFIIVKGALNFPNNLNTDLYYIWATENDTEITINGVTLSTKIDKGKFYEGMIPNGSEFAYITTNNKPVYIFHLTGVGQEATGTSLPSIKCTGSTEVSFVRSTSELFYLNIICKASEIDYFSINGVKNIITASMFTDIPGSSGWKAARININNLPNINNLIPANIRTSITNSNGLFHLGFLNGSASTGARLGYFSNYSKVTLAPNITSSSCLGGNIQLAAKNLPNVIYKWTGPNGFTSTISAPIIANATINDSGYYFVEANLVGCGTSTDSIHITINSLPTFQLIKTSDTVCLGNSKSIQFSLTGKSPWELVYSDGGIKNDTIKNINSSLYSFTVSPLQKTIYSFLSISDSNACLANAAALEFKDTLFVSKLPIADFNYSAIHCEKVATTFTDASIPDLDPIKEWNWDMGNGTKKMLDNNNPFAELYTNWGNYQVKLNLVSQLGCKSDTLKTIAIKSAPTVGYRSPSVCLDGGIAIFKDTSSSPDLATGFTYLWNFNAGPTPIIPAPTYDIGELTKAQPAVLYNKEGTYLVSLIVTTSKGCIDSLVKPFIINGSNPIAQYTVLKDTALCSNEEVIIKDSSWVYPGSIGKLHIDWGDGESSIIEDPVLNNQYKHLYSSNTLFNYGIKVNAYSGGTCVDDSLTNISLVIPPASFTIAPPTTPYLCINDTLHLIPIITGGTGPFTFQFATDNTNASFTNNIIKGLQQGSVNVNVNVKDAKNCLYTYTNSIGFNLPKLPIANFFANDTVICNGDSLSLKGTGGSSFKWYRNGNLEYTNAYESLKIGNEGNYSLIVNDGQCNSLPSTAIKIIEFEIPKISFDYNSISCTNGQLAISTDAVDKYKIHYNWDFGDGASSSLSKPLTHNYATKGEYIVTLKVKNDYCPRYDTLIVGDTVKVIEPVSPSNFTLFLLAEMDTLLRPLKIDSGYTAYHWSPTRYLSNPFIATPIFNGPGSSGRSLQYTLTRIDPNTTCEVADIYNLDISSDVVVAIPKAFTPNGDNLNDILKLELGAGLKILVDFKIFNKWGKLVFSTRDIREGWDGRVNGVDQEMDAYTYFIEYINYKDDLLRKKGTFALLR